MNPKQKRSSRNRAGSKGKFYQLQLCAFLIATGAAPAAPAPAAAGAETPFVNPFFMLSGALLTDSFDGPQLDATLWQSKIPRKALSGLYPGDVWALDLRHKRVRN